MTDQHIVYDGKPVADFEPLAIMRQFDLTIKMAYFCEWYLITMNATKAARNAGYAEPCNIAGHRALTNVGVRKYLELRFAERKITSTEIIDRLKAIADADISDYLIVDPQFAEDRLGDGVFKLLADGRVLDGIWIDLKAAIRDSNTGAIKSYKRVKGETVIELHDKVRALELLGRHYRLFADVVINPNKPDGTADSITDDELAAIAAEAPAGGTDVPV